MATEVEEEKEKEKQKPEEKPAARSRLIVRLGVFLISHSVLVSLICCIAGPIALLLLPVLAKNTYISENALMPGSANPLLSAEDVLEASIFVKDIIAKRTSKDRTTMEVPRLIGQHMLDVGAEVYYHKFQPQTSQFNPLRFFSSTPDIAITQNNGSCTSTGVNSVGILRAPRGDGKEAIVLVTPYNSQKVELSEALSLGLGLSIFSLLSRVTWLAKDIVWLAADSQFGEYTSVAAWLRDYHNPVFFTELGNADAGMCYESNHRHESSDVTVEGMKSYVFKRAGTMAAALVFKALEKKEREEKDTVTLYAEASNGQMPNLDLINIVHYLAVHRQGFRVKVGTVSSLVNSAWLEYIGEVLHRLGKLAKSLNPQWKFDIASTDYVEGTATLASSMYYQALGVPTGSHGAFRDYQVDAISLELSSRFSLNNENVRSAFLLRGGRLIEGTVRSVNNLLEKFHQSFFLYFLTAPNKFVSVGVYMIAFALLVAPLPVVAAALFSSHNKQRLSKDTVNEAPSIARTEETKITTGSWKWLQAAKTVSMVHLWSVIVSLLPYFISQIPQITPQMSMLVWVALSISTLLIFYLIFGSPNSTNGEWQLLKSVMIAAASIGLSLMSIINFATAQIGAMLIVPMCLMVRPLRRQLQVALPLRVLLLVCNLVLAIIGFPPAALLIAKGFTEGFGRVGFGDFWELVEFLWSWNSATYLYLLVVHLPCWLLYMHILLLPRVRCSEA